MTPTYPGSDDPRTTMRRHDRSAPDDAWITDLITRAPVGVLATVADDQPFVTPNLYAYDAATHAIILHTGRHGRFRENVAAHPRASFTVIEMGRLLPGDAALEFSVEYASAVVFGDVVIVDDPDQARRDLQLLMDKYAPHLRPDDDYRTTSAADLARTSVFRLVIEAWSGKLKAAPEDAPGAYWYGYTPMLESLRGR